MGTTSIEFDSSQYNSRGLQEYFERGGLSEGCAWIGDGAKSGSAFYRAFSDPDGGRHVFVGAVSMRDGELFTKPMCDDEGPVHFGCPRRILDLAGGVEGACCENGRKWRTKCYRQLELKALARDLEPGDRIALDSPVAFQSGARERFFMVTRKERQGLVCLMLSQDPRKDGGLRAGFLTTRQLLENGFCKCSREELARLVEEERRLPSLDERQITMAVLKGDAVVRMSPDPAVAGKLSSDPSVSEEQRTSLLSEWACGEIRKAFSDAGWKCETENWDVRKSGEDLAVRAKGSYCLGEFLDSRDGKRADRALAQCDPSEIPIPAVGGEPVFSNLEIVPMVVISPDQDYKSKRKLAVRDLEHLRKLGLNDSVARAMDRNLSR